MNSKWFKGLNVEKELKKILKMWVPLLHQGNKGFLMKVKVAQSCPTLCKPMDCPWNSPGQNTGVGSLSLLQGIFPIQGSNPGLLHYQWIIYQLSHKGSPRTLEWVDYPISSGSFQFRNQTGVSFIVGGFFTNWAIREAHELPILKYKTSVQ